MSLYRRVYSGFWYLAAPFVKLYLNKRARKQPQYRENWDQRFAKGGFPQKTKEIRIWIHAVSVGETRASIPIAEELLKAFPQADIIYTHMTPTGKEVSGELIKKFPERVQHCYLPYDFEKFQQKFIQAIKPDICLLMETEVWPNLTFVASKLNVPVILVNARLSEKSLRKTLRVGSLLRESMGRLTVTLAQSDLDAKRLKKAGCKIVKVTGNLKFDHKLNQQQLILAQNVKGLLSKKIILFASSREGEEELFINLIKSVGNKEILWLIVPRHPQRFGDVADLLSKDRVSFVKRSTVADWNKVGKDEGLQVMLGDSMGEMSFYYGLADVVLMGGSFGDYGSQSLIEPCLIGLPVIVGPSIYNFESVIEDAEKNNSIIRVSSLKEGLEEALALARGEDKRRILSLAAKQFAFSRKGGTKKTVDVIQKVLKERKNESPAS